MLADVTGDSRPDIVGFANAGVYVSVNNGDGTFGTPTMWVASYGQSAGGWRTWANPRFVVDVNGDGKDDIVGFSNAGVDVSLSTGSAFSTPTLVLSGYGYSAGGWRVQLHPRLVTDVTGDNRPDIVGFANAGVSVAVNKGDGTFGAPTYWTTGYGYSSGGWRVEYHPRYLG
jgi:hypothetical protein